jgi:hypothetical protein
MMQRCVREKYSQEFVERRNFGCNTSRIFASEQRDWPFRVRKEVTVGSIKFAELLGRFQIWKHYGEGLFDTVFAGTKPLNGRSVGRIHGKMESP